MKVTRYYICDKDGGRVVTKIKAEADSLVRVGWSITHEDFYG